MKKILAVLSVLIVSVVSLEAEGRARGHARKSRPPASTRAVLQSNAPWSADRDFGRDRAEDVGRGKKKGLKKNTGSLLSTTKVECKELRERFHEGMQRLRQQQKEDLARCRSIHLSNPKNCKELRERQKRAVEDLREHQKSKLANCS
ncbi:MAG: hypothetical protein HY644_03710 [Acidobacteria bacterium]|nr:hypothetical protein [Acidobacteriota bacterium]